MVSDSVFLGWEVGREEPKSIGLTFVRIHFLLKYLFLLVWALCLFPCINLPEKVIKPVTALISFLSRGERREGIRSNCIDPESLVLTLKHFPPFHEIFFRK